MKVSVHVAHSGVVSISKMEEVTGRSSGTLSQHNSKLIATNSSKRPEKYQLYPSSGLT